MSNTINVNSESYEIEESFTEKLTIPDCFVCSRNKIGKGHGEKKLYFGSKTLMRKFYGGEGFNAKCFLLKKDLRIYLETLEQEYKKPTFKYREKSLFKNLWEERKDKIDQLKEVEFFEISDQTQIKGPRGYVKSKDEQFELLRELSLPLISYISAMRLSHNGKKIFYWKLFVDFDILDHKEDALVFTYRKKSLCKPVGRRGQGKFRRMLLEECSQCPITHVKDQEILMASHIKPWRNSSKEEKIDPKNGFTLTPLYDKLFDRGYITFSDEKKMIVSKWLSDESQKLLGIKTMNIIEDLPIDDERKKYLEYHRKYVFKDGLL